MVSGEHISKYHQATSAAFLAMAGFVTERIRTFIHLSSFIALLSERGAERFSHWEIEEGRPARNVRYVVRRKPSTLLIYFPWWFHQ
jgi:hypothetical protein